MSSSTPTVHPPSSASKPNPSIQVIKTIGLFPLVMLIAGAIDSTRNLPTTALFGPQLIFFLILSAITFLIPVALVSAELTPAGNEPSGIYYWVRRGLGPKSGVVAIWLQWISTMVWYPTILSFIAGTVAYLINPALAQNKTYLVTIILIVFWGLTLINLKGLHLSAHFTTFCASVGIFLPMLLIIGLAILWITSGKPLAVHFTAQTLLPTLEQRQSWISLTAIMTAFLGMELASVHVHDVKDPQRNFPKALLYSTLIILMTMLLGSLAIAIVLPSKDINLVSGVMQAITAYFQAYHLDWFLPAIAVLVVIGAFGHMINWIISPAKGLLHAGEHDYLPKYFCQENKHGVASRILVLQAILVSLICLAFLLMPSVNGSYWLLTDLSTELYIMMYVLLFIAAIAIRYKFPNQIRPFSIPGKTVGLWITSLLGLFGCSVTLLVGFFPPSTINVGGLFHYDMIFTLGIVLMTLPVVLFFIYKRYGTHGGNPL